MSQPPPSQGAGPQAGDVPLTLQQLRALAVSAGFADPDTAAAIAMAESSGYPHAQGDPRGPFLPVPNGVSTSFGLWQIHTPVHPEFDPTRLLDPAYNAHAAVVLSNGGTSWSPWSTFNDGSYRQFMPGGGGVSA